MDIRTALGERVRHLRTLQGLSQEALAERAGLHATQIQRIEQGKLDPRLSTLCCVAAGLGVDLGNLVAWESTSDSTALDDLQALLAGRPGREQQLILEVCRTILQYLPRDLS